MTFTSRFAAFFASFVLFLAGCGGNPPPVQQDEDCKPPPPATFEMITQWADAQAYSDSCEGKAQVDDFICTQKQAPNQDCEAQYNLDQSRCFYYYALRLNKIPVRECGVKIFEVASSFNPESYQVNLLQGDFDGDGIDNWTEIQMGYNLCTPNSFGSCINDQDLDYDDDGIPNGKDPEPRCNNNDPSGNQSDCI